MTALDLTAFGRLLKRVYSPKKVAWLSFKDNPFLATVKKNTGFSGSAFGIPVDYQSTQGRSATFATAVANKTPSAGVQFLLTTSADYSLASITVQTILQSQNNAGALLKASQAEIDRAVYTCSRSLAAALVRNGGGARGRLNATTPTGVTTATLLNPEDSVNFEPGMVIKTSATDGTSGAVKAGSVTLTAVDYDTGVLTASANWDTGIATVAGSDYLFQEGDFGAMLPGIAGWIPSTAPGATAFYGVNRSVSPTRLGGIRVVSTASTMEEKLIDGLIGSSRHGAKTTHIFGNPTDYGSLVKELGAKAVYDKVKSTDGTIGFRSMKLIGPQGDVDFVPDLNFPQGRVYGLNMDTWELVSAGDAPFIMDLDGTKMLREASADAVEVRVQYYAALACYAPGQNWTMAV